ncbi:hypothetical protein JQ628_33670 [Bradyrhizobium lablabi]|uniref:hypothetical protein n=1 Tax=Bradyrhizobium lablabi TaxID=722472 RepID=UPI001BAD8F7F|nr:hypothetical protein [Bradyrhizobium lablabi]MBR1126511.1 hypothetical protein [Bradyrhizobium lablabi]
MWATRTPIPLMCDCLCDYPTGKSVTDFREALRTLKSKMPKADARKKSNLPCNLNLIWVVQITAQNIPLYNSENQKYSLPVSCPP